MNRSTKVQMAIEDASEWDDGTLEDYINNLESRIGLLESHMKEIGRYESASTNSMILYDKAIDKCKDIYFEVEK
jgi:phage gp36-like protein